VNVLEGAVSGAAGDELAHLPLPDTYRAAVVREGTDRPLAIEDVPVPPLAADEVYVAVMASSINYTTVWSALGWPVPTSTFLRRLGPPHDRPYHVVGSDAAGIVVRTGAGVRRWKPGDHVVVNPLQTDPEDPGVHRVWGYETNFGGLAELAVVRAAQLLPRPACLTWEEAGTVTLCASTAYRMVVSPNGAGMKQGDVVLVWGATGGVGGFAVQFVLNGGGIPVGVVSSADRAALLRGMGCQRVIDRVAEGYRFWKDEHTQDEAEWRRFGSRIRELAGGDPDIVVEHPGRETMGASVYVVRPGGTVVTCAATTGYLLQIDNRHLWMRRKRLVGSNLADQPEAAAANRLIDSGAIRPTVSAVYPLERTAEAVEAMRANRHTGKLGIRCLASRP
jgi:crotonyl-CoA reductase